MTDKWFHRTIPKFYFKFPNNFFSLVQENRKETSKNQVKLKIFLKKYYDSYHYFLVLENQVFQSGLQKALDKILKFLI